MTQLSLGKIGHGLALFLDFHMVSAGLPTLVVFWVLSCNQIFNLCQKKKEKENPGAEEIGYADNSMGSKYML